MLLQTIETIKKHKKTTNAMSSVSKIPFGDPLWLNRSYSPYYTDSHRRLQKEVRSYVDTYISPFCDEWEKQGFVPLEVRHLSPLSGLALP